MHEFLRQANPTGWSEYQLRMYGWCLDVARGRGTATLADIRSFLPTFLSAFNCKISSSKDFVHEQSNEVPAPAAIPPGALARNVRTCEGVNVEVATVHSVKGETHTATLYMETFYERGGGGNYESERLADQLKGQAISIKAHDLVRQSAKMVYVGFSRPTHLLCFAVHQSRFAKFEAGINLDVWEVVRL
ncbi:MAG: hypothetical protein Q8K71_13980 [Polaromonas sp.]|nr:hypothetical protein [Polaromonas sp.]